MIIPLLVEHRGFEPLTSTMRTLRATNCANAPRMIGGFVQTSVETARGLAPRRTQWEPSFHHLISVRVLQASCSNQTCRAYYTTRFPGLQGLFV